MSRASPLEAAAEYLRRGWYVVPIPRGSKWPNITDWPNLRLTEVDLPKHWSNGQGVGLLLGQPPKNLVDVDLDVPEARRLARAFLPETDRVHGRPGSPGSHFWYETTDPIATLQFRDPTMARGSPDKDHERAMIVELRSTGGQTLVPPSIHPGGEAYQWEVEGEPALVDGDTLRQAVATLAAASLLARHWPARGSRDVAAMALAGGLLRGGWSEDRVAEFIVAVAEAANDEEAHARGRKAVSTARTLAAGESATGWPSLAGLVGEQVVDAVRQWLGLRDQAAETPWAERQTAPAWPEPLAVEAFHGPAGALVQAISPYSEADPAALLAHVLGGIGALIGPAVESRAGDARHPARLNFVIVGATSKGRKGSAMRPVERLLALLDLRFTSERVTEGLSSGEGVIWQVRDTIEKYERQGKGPDGHVELVEVDPGIEDKRLWVVESEFASVLRVAQRDGNTLTTILRRLWDSGNVQSLTKNSPAKTTGAHVCITGHVTRDELLRYLDRTELASGFANRFLWIAARRARCLPDGEGVPAEVLEAFVAPLLAVLDWTSSPRVLRRDPEARALWHEVYPTLSEGQLGLFGAATSRAEAQVLRLSVLYATLDRAELIRAEHLLAALAVWRYAEASASWLFGDATGDPVADEILRALRKGGPLTRNDLVNLFERHQNRTRIDRALGLLLSAGLVRMERKTDTGGRPAEVWHAV